MLVFPSCPLLRYSANSRYVKLSSSPKQLTTSIAPEWLILLNTEPNESSFEGVSLLIKEETLLSLEKTRLLYISLVCSSLVFCSSNKDCQISMPRSVEAVSIALTNSFPLRLFSFSTFNDRTSGSALQPLRYRPSEDQGSTANTRQEENNHQRPLEALVMQGPKGLSKLAQNLKTI